MRDQDPIALILHVMPIRAPALAVAMLLCLPACSISRDNRISADTEMQPRLSLGDCTNVGAVFPVSAEAARAALPSGFEAVAVSKDSAAAATLYVIALRCTQTWINGAPQGPAALAYAELAVVPPTDQAVSGIEDYTVPVLFAAQPARLGAVLAVYRLGQAGAGSVTWENPAPAGTTVITAQLGDATLKLTATASSAPSPLDSGTFALFGVQEGRVRSLVGGHSEGGAAARVTVRLETRGGPALLPQAPTPVRGFSVSGFSLDFKPLQRNSASDGD